MQYSIHSYKGHVIITDENDKIISHCDNYQEAQEEILELQQQIRNELKNFSKSFV